MGFLSSIEGAIADAFKKTASNLVATVVVTAKHKDLVYQCHGLDTALRDVEQLKRGALDDNNIKLIRSTKDTIASVLSELESFNASLETQTLFSVDQRDNAEKLMAIEQRLTSISGNSDIFLALQLSEGNMCVVLRRLA